MKQMKKIKRILRGMVMLLGMGLVFGNGLSVHARVQNLDELISNTNSGGKFTVDWTGDGECWTIATPVAEEDQYCYVHYEETDGPSWPSCWYGYVEFMDETYVSEEWMERERAGYVNFPTLMTGKEAELAFPGYPENPEKKLYVTTGVPTGFITAGVGQHLYTVERKGIIPIYKWEVDRRMAQCIQHNAVTDEFHGLSSAARCCNGAYYSGWFGYCADCGGRAESYLIYMDYDSARQLQAIDNNYEYFYRCHCTHLEQAPGEDAHLCKEVSWNQYKVVYMPRFWSYNDSD